MLKIATATSANVMPRSRRRFGGLRRGRWISGGSMSGSSILVEHGSGSRDVAHAGVGRARHQHRNHTIEAPFVCVLDSDLGANHVGERCVYGLWRQETAVDGQHD